MSTLNDPFGRSRLPGDFKRADRVRLLGEFSQAVLTGREPSNEAVLFIGGAVAEWLSKGGNLERDFLQVVKPKSHETPSVIWRRSLEAHQDERQPDTTPRRLAPSRARG